MSNPHRALEYHERHMTQAFERLNAKLAFHREHENLAQIMKIKARIAKLEIIEAFERSRIQKKIKDRDNPPVVFKNKRRARR